MQVVLLEDVKALGKKGQTVNMNDGYARNFILPEKLGVGINSKNLNDLKSKKANGDRITTEQLTTAKELEAKLGESSVILTIKAGEGGRAFGSVSSKEIGEAIRDQLGTDTDKKKITLSGPIKSIGNFKAPVKLHKEVAIRLAVKVVEA